MYIICSIHHKVLVNEAIRAEGLAGGQVDIPGYRHPASTADPDAPICCYGPAFDNGGGELGQVGGKLGRVRRSGGVLRLHGEIGRSQHSGAVLANVPHLFPIKGLLPRAVTLFEYKMGCLGQRNGVDRSIGIMRYPAIGTAQEIGAVPAVQIIKIHTRIHHAVAHKCDGGILRNHDRWAVGPLLPRLDGLAVQVQGEAAGAQHIPAIDGRAVRQELDGASGVLLQLGRIESSRQGHVVGGFTGGNQAHREHEVTVVAFAVCHTVMGASVVAVNTVAGAV